MPSNYNQMLLKVAELSSMQNDASLIEAIKVFFWENKGKKWKFK